MYTTISKSINTICQVQKIESSMLVWLDPLIDVHGHVKVKVKVHVHKTTTDTN